MNKTKLLIANIKGNMKLEGMSVNQATINVIKEMSNPKLSSAQKNSIADKYEQELISKYSK